MVYVSICVYGWQLGFRILLYVFPSDQRNLRFFETMHHKVGKSWVKLGYVLTSSSTSDARMPPGHSVSDARLAYCLIWIDVELEGWVTWVHFLHHRQHSLQLSRGLRIYRISQAVRGGFTFSWCSVLDSLSRPQI